MAESEEELKSLLMRVKEESEKAGLKLNIPKTKIRASGHITSWQIVEETMKTERLYFLGLQKYMNCELPDVQAGLRKGRGTRDQIPNIHWIIEKAREFQKNTTLTSLLH